MNAWKKLLEQDNRKAERYNEKCEKKEKKSDGFENDKSRSRLGSGEEFLSCQPNKNLTEEERKKVINSVKLTKALVLLGYNCWSELEPENKQGVEGHVENALKLRIEKKIQEIDEYRRSTLYAKTLNNELHEKMVDAEKERSDALYKDLPAEFFDNDETCDFSFLKRTNSKEKKKKRDQKDTLQVPGMPKRRDSISLLQIPSMQRRRSSFGIGSAPIPFLEYDETNAKLQIKAFREAFKILMKEFEQRKIYRVKRKAAKLKAKNRILAAWAFRKRQEDAKKSNAEKAEKKEKLEKSLGIYSSNNASSDVNKSEEVNNGDKTANKANEDSGISESNFSETNDDATATTKDAPNSENTEKAQKRKTVVVNFRKDRLIVKSSQRKAGNKYYLRNDKADWTEADHLKHAQTNLKRVQEQHRIRNNIEVVEDVVEEEIKRKVPKFKDVALKIMRINAVRNAFRFSESSNNEKEIENEKEKEESNEEENKDVFNKERINKTAKSVIQSFNINSIKTPKSVRRHKSYSSVKEKKYGSVQSKQRLLSVPSAPQLPLFEKSPINSKRQSAVRPGHSKNMFPSPKQQAKSLVQRSPSDTRKKLQLGNKLSMVQNTKDATKMEECMLPEDKEPDVKVEENAKEKKKKEEAKKWDQLKKKYGEQAAEETKDRWLKIAEEEKAYQEQKRIEEEKERRREEKLANILAIENNDYFDEDDDVFAEGDSCSDSASIESFQFDDADLEEFERDFERTTMMDIAKDVRDRLTSVSD